MQKLVLISLFLILASFLFSDTIEESVYSDPVLDGYMQYEPISESFYVNNWMYEMCVGDVDSQWVDHNTSSKAYISFDLPEIPEGYHVDSVYVKLYQYESVGQDSYYQFPEWNVVGGDTIKCVLSHIIYGDVLDPGDWEKGDPGNAYTLDHNVGVVSESHIVGYRYIDVTECVLNDYAGGRSRTQYRIAFQIETDNDFMGDFISFITGNPPIDEYTPILNIIFSNEISSNEDVTSNTDIELKNYPNPFNPQTTISYSVAEPGNVQLQIYNTKGQLIETLVDDFKYAGNYAVEWNAEDQASGVYFYQIKTDNSVIRKKCILLK